LRIEVEPICCLGFEYRLRAIVLNIIIRLSKYFLCEGGLQVTLNWRDPVTDYEEAVQQAEPDRRNREDVRRYGATSSARESASL